MWLVLLVATRCYRNIKTTPQMPIFRAAISISRSFSMQILKPRAQRLRFHALFASLCLLMFGCSESNNVNKHKAEADTYLSEWELSKSIESYTLAIRQTPEDPDCYLQIGKAYFYRGNLRQAYQAFKECLDHDADNLEARQYMARSYLESGNLAKATEHAVLAISMAPSQVDSAILIFAESAGSEADAASRLRELEELERKMGSNATLLTAKGILYARLGKFEKAIPFFDAALEIKPKSDATLARLADALWKFGKTEEADRHFQKAASHAPPYSSTAIKYARFKRSLGEIDAAAQILSNALVLSPEQISARLALARIFHETEAFEDGIKQTQAILSFSNSKPEALLLDGELKLAAKRYEDALVPLESLAYSYPNSANTQLKLGTTLLELDRADEALTHLRRARFLAPESEEAHMLLAGLDLRRSDFSGAISTIRSFAEKNPNNFEVLRFLADSYLANAQYSKALSIYLKLDHANPSRAEIKHCIGICMTGLKDFQNAYGAFMQAYTSDSTFLPALKQLTVIDAYRGEFDAAHERLDRYADTVGRDPEYLYTKALLHYQQQEFENAELLLRETIQLRPNQSQAYQTLSELLVTSGRIEDATNSLYSAFNSGVKDQQTLMLLAQLLELRGLAEQAAEIYENILEADSEFSAALNNLAYLYSNSIDKLGRALELAEKARKLRPNDPEIADTLGWIMYRRGNYKWAKSLLLEANSKLPDNPELLYHLGLVYYSLGEHTEAISCLETAIKDVRKASNREDIETRIELLKAFNSQEMAAFKQLFERRVEQVSIDTISLLALSEICLKEKKVERSEFFSNRILANQPSNPFAIANLALAQMERGNLAQGLELARRCYSETPENTRIQRTVGEIAYANGLFSWARTLLERSLENKARTESNTMLLAKVLFASGNPEKALAMAQSPELPLSKERKQLIRLIEGFDSISCEVKYSDDGAFTNDAFLRMASSTLEQVDQSQKFLDSLLLLRRTYPEFVTANKAFTLHSYRIGSFGKSQLEIAKQASMESRIISEVMLATAAQHYHSGDSESAKRILQQLPHSSQVAYYRGLVAKGSGDPEKALLYLKECEPNELLEYQASELEKAIASLNSNS